MDEEEVFERENGSQLRGLLREAVLSRENQNSLGQEDSGYIHRRG